MIVKIPKITKTPSGIFAAATAALKSGGTITVGLPEASSVNSTPAANIMLRPKNKIPRNDTRIMIESITNLIALGFSSHVLPKVIVL